MWHCLALCGIFWSQENAEEAIQELKHAASHPHIPGYMPENEASTGAPAVANANHAKHEDAFRGDADDNQRKEYATMRKSVLHEKKKSIFRQPSKLGSGGEAAHPVAIAPIAHIEVHDFTEKERRKLLQSGSKVDEHLTSFETQVLPRWRRVR